MLETQLKALDEITVLATDDPFVRQVFSKVLHASHLIPKYRENDLQILSSKATISIRDTEVHEFWWRFTLPSLHTSTHGRRSAQDKVLFENGLALYFRYALKEITYASLLIHATQRDPNVSFLLGRLLCREFSRFSPFLADHLFFFRSTCLTYIKVATTVPQVIEWEVLRKVFVLVFMQTIVDDIPNGTKVIML